MNDLITLSIKCRNCDNKLCNYCLFQGYCHNCKAALSEDLFNDGVHLLMESAQQESDTLKKWVHELDSFWKEASGDS